MFPKLHMNHQLLYFGKKLWTLNQDSKSSLNFTIRGCGNLGTSQKFSEPFPNLLLHPMR